MDKREANMKHKVIGLRSNDSIDHGCLYRLAEIARV